MPQNVYTKLYKQLEKVGFTAGDNKTAVYNAGEYTVKLKFNGLMKPCAVEVVGTMEVNDRSRGKVKRSFTALTFHADGSAWVTIPSKLDDVLAAVNDTIKHFKEKAKA
jgi:hypothetical protein